MNSFKKYLYWATLGLYIYIPFHIFISQYFSTFTGGLDAWKIAKDVFTAALVSVIVCTTLITRKYTRPFLVFVGFAIVYLLLHIISWIATDQPNDTGLLATVYNNRLIWYLLIGYGLALLMPEPQHRRTFTRVLIGASTVVCLIGLAQWILPKDIMTHFGYSIERGVKPNFFIDDKPDFPRIMSTIRDPNSLGAFLILPTTLLVILLTKLRDSKQRILIMGLLLLHSLAILLTFSRGAWIGMTVALIAVGIFTFKNHIHISVRKLILPAVILIFLTAGVLYSQRNSYFVQNIVLHSDSKTVAADPNELRLEFLNKSINGVENNPEGNGPGTAGLVSTRLTDGGLLTENYYLQIAYEVGLMGLLIFVAFMIYVCKILWSLRHKTIAQALLASFVGLACINLLIHGWSNEALAASWFMLAGLVIGSTKE